MTDENAIEITPKSKVKYFSWAYLKTTEGKKTWALIILGLLILLWIILYIFGHVELANKTDPAFYKQIKKENDSLLSENSKLKNAIISRDGVIIGMKQTIENGNNAIKTITKTVTLRELIYDTASVDFMQGEFNKRYPPTPGPEIR